MNRNVRNTLRKLSKYAENGIAGPIDLLPQYISLEIAFGSRPNSLISKTESCRYDTKVLAPEIIIEITYEIKNKSRLYLSDIYNNGKNLENRRTICIVVNAV